MSELELKRFLFVSIISADNDEFTEDEKQAVLTRYDDNKDVDKQDWEYVLEPIKEKENYARYLNLLKYE